MSQLFLNQSEFNFELWFCTEILGLSSLHYGYWENPVDVHYLNLDQVKLAQMQYTETLLDMIPSETKTILDVGCGVGDVAFCLQDEGYLVTALSPDVNHQSFFEHGNGNHIRFYPLKFEDFYPPQLYDLVLMSESQGYIPIREGFHQAKKCLNPGGYLLVSGNFRKSEEGDHFLDCHALAEYKNIAETLDFDLVLEVDITKQVLPTLQYAHAVFEEKILPTLDAAGLYLQKQTGLKYELFRFFTRGEQRRLMNLKEMYLERLNPDLYQQHAVYKRLLFRKRN